MSIVDILEVKVVSVVLPSSGLQDFSEVGDVISTVDIKLKEALVITTHVEPVP